MRPIPLARKGESAVLYLRDGSAPSVILAGDRLRATARTSLGFNLQVLPLADSAPVGGVVALGPPWDGLSRSLLRKAGVGLDSDGQLGPLSGTPPIRRAQGFFAGRFPTDRGEGLLLAAETDMGIRNALITLSDRLYQDSQDTVVIDPFDGTHAPAFDRRHLKTDAMFCGGFNIPFDYWDPATPAGVDEFADWLASFRITDYEFLAFIRGWGLSFASSRFPNLSHPRHPNTVHEFYPRLIDRLHRWGIRVWASDIFIASGYTFEPAMVPEALSPCSDPAQLLPFRAGEDSQLATLGDPQSVLCLSHPKPAVFCGEVVDDLMGHYPALDGLDFHTGHMFCEGPGTEGRGKICRCPNCRNLEGNREGVYRCFKRAYEAAVARKPDIRVKTSVKMFGDATRHIADRWKEFPQLEFFCWLRWAGAWCMENGDAPVTIGHEDAGGGLEAGYWLPKVTLEQLRNYPDNFEALITYNTSVTRSAKLPSVSWEPALHRELEHVYFCYSQFTWEPALSWAEFARRCVLRSRRRLDTELIAAYRLALEANAALTHWGHACFNHTCAAQNMMQTLLQHNEATGLLGEISYAADRRDVQEKIAELGKALEKMGLIGRTDAPPVRPFDLRGSLVKAYHRLRDGDQTFHH
jgi:hypothetical protein